MALLYDLAKEYRTLSIVGMAKNAGKTTALNYLIEEAMDEGVVLGITSTGRDGETTDLVTGTEKPRVYLDQDTLVSVPSQLYDLAEAGLEIVKKTPYSTAIGELMICRVRDAGYVQIAGPVSVAESKKLCQDMFDLGVELIMIDGAIDRKSIASPETSDAIILATGAVLSRSLKKVVEETAHQVALYSLPEMEEGPERTMFEENIQNDVEDKVMLLDDEGNLKKLNITTGLGNSKIIDEAIDEHTKYIYIPGALTDSVVCDISPKKLKQVHLILKDPTKIFMKATEWGFKRKKGLKVSVLKNIKVVAVTVNPWAPLGYSFDSDELVGEMKKALPEIPIIDVRK